MAAFWQGRVHFVAGAAFLQGQVFPRIELHGRRSCCKVKYRFRQAQYFRKVKSKFRGRRSTFARSNLWQTQHFCKVKCKIRSKHIIFAEFVTGAALSQGEVQNLWQAYHFRKVKYRFLGRRSAFARSSARAEFVIGTALSQGQVQNSWQTYHFPKVKYRFRGRRSTFARSIFAAGSQKSHFLSTKIFNFS